MRAKPLFVAILLLLLFPCFGGEDPVPKTLDLPPKKGDVTKNIHVLFDVSGSISDSARSLAFKEVQMLAMQGSDEFNLAVSVFADGHLRMAVKDPDCKLKPNWMGMPSAHHYKYLTNWLTNIQILAWATRLDSAIAAIIKENQENVTVIIISDCEFEKFPESVGMILKARKSKGHNPFKVGFVNVSPNIGASIYKRIKKNKFWYVNVAPKPEPEEEEEEDD